VVGVVRQAGAVVLFDDEARSPLLRLAWLGVRMDL
jgi:hypothetical protein